MYITLVLIHVVTMILSMVLMSSAFVAGLLGRRTAVRLANVGMATTVIGFVTGLCLMLDSPLTFKCAVLTVYVVGVGLLHYFGYGFGDIKKTRLVRVEA